MKRLVKRMKLARVSTLLLILVVTAAFFVNPAAAATYNGYGKTTKTVLWLYTWTWHSWTTVDTSQDTLFVEVAYPCAWTDFWNYYTFLGGFFVIQDNWRTYGPFLWTFANHWPAGGYYWWSISFPYTSTYTGMIVTVFWYYGGVDIFGGPTATEVHLQYWLRVGNGGGGGGGCPMLFVYDGSDYVCEGLLDIHNPEGIDVVYDHTLVTTPQRENDAYLLRLTEHPQTHSYIDQVKLYATLEDGTMINLPLIYAWHSEDGNVLPQLLFSDERKTDTLGADLNNGTSQSIDLKFASLSPNLEITGFVFEIEGNNRIYKL